MLTVCLSQSCANAWMYSSKRVWCGVFTSVIEMFHDVVCFINTRFLKEERECHTGSGAV